MTTVPYRGPDFPTIIRYHSALKAAHDLLGVMMDFAVLAKRDSCPPVSLSDLEMLNNTVEGALMILNNVNKNVTQDIEIMRNALAREIAHEEIL